MKCRLALTLDTDKAYLITKKLFSTMFNQSDFLKRESINIRQEYLSTWFYTENEQKYFYIPTVTLIAGETQFINGRHRTAVLFNEIYSIPMAFTNGEAQRYAIVLGLIPLKKEEGFYLPDLEIKIHNE